MEADVVRPATERLVVISHLHVKPHCVERFIAAMEKLLPESAKEDGVIRYEWLQSRTDPTKFTFVDLFRDQAAFDFHCGTEHIQSFAAAMADCLVSAPVSEMYFSREALRKTERD